MNNISTDICVVGGGSAGFAAALRSAQKGCRTVLVEKESMLGGTSTVCGVNAWEPVAGADNCIARKLYEKMSEIPNACGVYHIAAHCGFADSRLNNFPGGLYKIAPELTYDDTLKKGYVYGGPWSLEQWNGIIFEPEILSKCMEEMLAEANCTVIKNHACCSVNVENGHISSIVLDDGTCIEAKIFIDNCGILAVGAKCQMLIGSESKNVFHEPDAPDFPDISHLNGVTMIFRITPVAEPAIEPCEVPPRRGVMVANEYPNGDYNCNMLPTMTGAEFMSMPHDTAIAECERRVRGFWRYVQENYEWGRKFKISKIFHNVGIREIFRVRCQYMLNENDLVEGIKRQKHDDIIAVADHHMDLHGSKSTGKTVVPYGIPLRCLLPLGTDNLFVVGRIAGFSCLAASSCRLARTMMLLGEAAGNAAAVRIKSKLPPEIENQKMMF